MWYRVWGISRCVYVCEGHKVVAVWGRRSAVVPSPKVGLEGGPATGRWAMGSLPPGRKAVAGWVWGMVGGLAGPTKEPSRR